MIYDITEIKWDTDGQNPKELNLPNKVRIEIDDTDQPNQPIEDKIADYLSHKYGWCVLNYRYKSALSKEQTKLKKFLEENEFRVFPFLQDNDIRAYIENWTSGGEDMIITLHPFSFEELKSYIEEYDIDEHIDIMMEDKMYKECFTYRKAVEDQEDWLNNWKDVIELYEKGEKKEEYLTFTLSATQQRHIIDLLFDDLELAKRQMQRLSPNEQEIMSAHTNKIEVIINILSKPEKTQIR